MMSFRTQHYVYFALAAAGILTADPKPVLADPPPPPIPKKTLQMYVLDALRQALEDSASGPIARKTFESEVVSEPFPFVSNYRQDKEGTQVQVDKEKFLNFLKFSSNQFTSVTVQGGTPSVCIKMRASQDCAACEALTAPLESGWMSRLEKRGFLTKPGPAISNESNLGGERSFEDYSARGSEARCDGVLYGEIVPDRAADEDDEGDEIKVRATSYFLARDMGGHKIQSRGTTVAQVPRELDAAKGEGKQFVPAMVSRQAADLFAQAAGKSSGGAAKLAEEERYLRLENVQDFASYVKFKQVVLGAMPDLKLEERFISPGLFEFMVAGQTPLNEIAKAIKELSFGEKNIEIVKSSPTEIAMVLK